MTHSKFIPIVLAALCGLAMQFQTSAANAQQKGTFGGSQGTYVTPDYALHSSHFLYSPSTCVTFGVNHEGNLVLEGNTQDPVVMWMSPSSWQNCGSGPGTCPDTPNHLDDWFWVFQPDGTLVVYNQSAQIGVWSNWSIGSGGSYLAVQDNGDLAIYDSGGNQLWAASWQSNFDPVAQVAATLCSVVASLP